MANGTEQDRAWVLLRALDADTYTQLNNARVTQNLSWERTDLGRVYIHCLER